jgi:biofilm PGA synthesis protein PgaA
MTPSGASSCGRRRQLLAKNHAAGAITVLGYGQRLRWNNVVDTGVMLNWDKRPYDGKRENNLAITLDANIRF